MAGVIINPTTGLTTTEAGGIATFDVRLETQPTDNVTLNLNSSNTNEATLSTSTLQFNPANWDSIQTVTITGVDDFIDDDDTVLSIITSLSESADEEYRVLDVPDLTVRNTDNDAAGITVSPLSGLTTSESGTSETFSVKLDSESTADVTIGLRSSLVSEGTIDKATLTFTAADWNIPQVVTVTGQDDDIDDDDKTYQIVTEIATSGDEDYSGRDAADVSLINTDDDTRGFVIAPITRLTTTESGGSDSFTLRLRSQPSAPVSIGLSVSDISEGSIDKEDLTFTVENWSTAQTVTVTGVNDDASDGNVTYSIITAAATSTDADYAGQNPADIAVINNDDDVSGVLVVPTSGLTTNEGGQTASFTVVLTTAPLSAVTVGLNSSDATEGTVSTNSLLFDQTNWNTPQTVTITGVNDNLDDGDIAYTIQTASIVSNDPSYNGKEVPDVNVTNIDDDAAGVLVAPTSGLVTSESGTTATFTVRLTAQPESNVVIGLASNNPSEGTVSVPSATFTSQNWNVSQTITVTGMNDNVADGPVSYSIITAATVSQDSAFNDLPVDDVSLTNTDDDNAEVQVVPVSGLTTSESGGSATFSVTLGTIPSDEVSIGVQSSDTSEGTVDKSTLTFTPLNWNTPQIVTVSGVDDPIDDGDIDYSITLTPVQSADAAYNALTAPSVSVTNTNNDTRDVLIQPTSGLQTSESGMSSTFTVVLTAEPVNPVTVDLQSSLPSEGTIDKSSVTFNSTNWNVPQTVTVTGVDDVLDDGDKPFSIVTSIAAGSDSDYLGIAVADVSVTNIDDDVKGVALIPSTGLETTESGQTTSFELVLTSQPTADVTINLASSNITEGTIDRPQVTFTPANWNVRQRVTVTGVDDNIVDGSQSYSIITSATTSTDTEFNGINPPDVSVTNRDNDSAALTIASSSVIEGTGNGDTFLVFDVLLSEAVNSPFRVGYSSSDGTAKLADGDYTSGIGTLNFTGTANEVQKLAVRITRDNVVESEENLSVRLTSLTGVSESIATRINLQSIETFGTIIDDDTTTITITVPTTQNEGTSQGDTPFTFNVISSNPVQGGFSLAYATNDGTAQIVDSDYIDNDGVISFSGVASESKPITVMVKADDRVELNETFNVTIGAVTGLPANLVTNVILPTAPASATIQNDDFPKLTLTDVTVSHVEGTGNQPTEFRFQVQLTDAVVDPDGFTIPFFIDDGTTVAASGDFIDNDSTLSFAGTAGETKFISVFVGADSIVEPDETFRVRLQPIVGLAPDQTITVPTTLLTTTIVNDDTASVILTTNQSSRNEGEEFELTATLSSGVQGGFTIGYATADGTATIANNDYVNAAANLTFAGTAGETRTIKIASQADTKVELDEIFSVSLQPIGGIDPSLLSAITVGNAVSLSVLNNDTATITVTSVAAVNEGSSTASNEIVFEVALSAPVEGGFTLDYQTADGTAKSASDYTESAGTLVFSGTAAEKKIVRVKISPDAMVEGDETFTFSIGQIVGLGTGLEPNVSILSNSATGIILNDDKATLTITGPAPINEGTAETPTEFPFTITLSGAVQGGLSVTYSTVDGTAAVADSDFVENASTLVFNGTAGETKTIVVLVTADNRVEADEKFSVALGAITGLPETAMDDVTFVKQSAEATIVSEDFSRLLFADTTVSAVEGSSPNGFTDFTFTVTLSDAVTDADGFTVPITINDGTAKSADGDYQDNDKMLRFNGTTGETQTVIVKVRQDAIVEGDETFMVKLGAITGLSAGQRVEVPNDTLNVTIQDDDTARLTLSSAAASQNEGNDGETIFVFDVTLSSPLQTGFDVAYRTNDDTATVSDGDYVDNDGSLAFTGTAQEKKQITVRVNGDSVVEGDEMFTVSLGEITNLNAAILERLTIEGSPFAATIVSDDVAAISITGPGSLSEGTGSGTKAFEFTVTLNNNVASGFSLAYSTNDLTATIADGDYIDNDDSLSFVGIAGETKTIRVEVISDGRAETDETFSVVLGEVTASIPSLASAISVNRNPVIATIENDDSATISFISDSSVGVEVNRRLEIPVRLNVSAGGTILEPVTVRVIQRAGGTASSADFSLSTSTVTFPPGSSDGAIQNVVLTIADDNITENEETVILGLELVEDNTTDIKLGFFTSNTVTITDDPMDAVIEGRVVVDANNDGIISVGEMTLAQVTIRLVGTSIAREPVNRETTTDSSGFYRFSQLPAGTYSITQVQPADYMDGREFLGTVAGVASGTIAEDRFDEVVLRPSQVGTGYLFSERGLSATQVNRFRVLSRPRNEGNLGSPVTTEMLGGVSSTSGNTSANLTPSNSNLVQRVGSQLIVSGTAGVDVVRISPSSSGNGSQLTLEVNGTRTQYASSDITSIVVLQSDGRDELYYDDTPGIDTLTAETDRVVITSSALRIESIASDLVRALSNSGGNDRVTRNASALDYALELEGNWL